MSEHVTDSSADHKLLESRTITLLVLASITLAGMGIRAYRLADRSIWYDESSSWIMSQASFPEMMRRIAGGSHPPLYYLVLRMWTEVFGDSLWAMRGLSVVLAGATISGAYLLLVEALRSQETWTMAHRRWVGLFAAALVATSLLHIRASWDARMYTLGTALLVFSGWTFFWALNDPAHAWRRWIAHGIVTLLFLYTHYFALFSVAAQAAFIGGLLASRHQCRFPAIFRDAIFRRAFLTYSLVAAGWAAWLPVFARQRAQHEDNWWTGPFLPSSMPRAFGRTFLLTLDVGEPMVVGTLLLMAFASVVVAILWRGKLAEWYAATMALVPLDLCILYSTMGRNVFEVRYLIFAHVFVLLCIALFVGRLSGAALRTVAALVLLVNTSAAYVGYWSKLNVTERPGVKGAVAYIEAAKAPDDQVIVTDPMTYYPALYHVTNRQGWRVYNSGTPFPFYAGGAVGSAEDLILPEQVQQLEANADSVWVVDGWGGGWLQVPSHWQQESVKQFQEVFEFQGVVTVTRYSLTKTTDATGRSSNVYDSQGLVRQAQGATSQPANWDTNSFEIR